MQSTTDELTGIFRYRRLGFQAFQSQIAHTPLPSAHTNNLPNIPQSMNICYLSHDILSIIYAYTDSRCYVVLTCLCWGLLMTNSVRVTSAVPPLSNGMGFCLKCSSMSYMFGNHKCCTLHWPISLRVIRRCLALP